MLKLSLLVGPTLSDETKPELCSSH